MRIKTVINNTQASSRKTAQFLNNKLQNMQILRNTFNTKNSKEITEEHTQKKHKSK